MKKLKSLNNKKEENKKRIPLDILENIEWFSKFSLRQKLKMYYTQKQIALKYRGSALQWEMKKKLKK
jgi:hypothetical protein